MDNEKLSDSLDISNYWDALYYLEEALRQLNAVMESELRGMSYMSVSLCAKAEACAEEAINLIHSLGLECSKQAEAKGSLTLKGNSPQGS